MGLYHENWWQAILDEEFESKIFNFLVYFLGQNRPSWPVLAKIDYLESDLGLKVIYGSCVRSRPLGPDLNENRLLQENPWELGFF